MSSSGSCDALNSRQRNILQFVEGRLSNLQNDPIYRIITGPSGTGKSELLKAVKEAVVTHFGKEEACMVTAPTDSAAWSIEGPTIHTLLKIPKDLRKAFQPLKRIDFLFLKKKTKDLEVLIIDEVGMMTAELLAAVSATLQQVRVSSKPFGGLSVLLFGDLTRFQPGEGRPVWEEVSPIFRPALESVAPCTVKDLWPLFQEFRLCQTSDN